MHAPGRKTQSLRGAMLTVLLPLALASDNGRAQRPPMGWRCWNQYQGRINQAIMESSFRLLASPSEFPPVEGAATSLRELGYSDAGLDDGWQLCNQRVSPENPHAFHTLAGAPIVGKSQAIVACAFWACFERLLVIDRHGHLPRLPPDECVGALPQSDEWMVRQ